ncbi:MAG: Ig-like domain repeat protein [Terracidiphilus sp.]|nr:Ig-like domain repeat protein [Terracidiphilus sp.]
MKSEFRSAVSVPSFCRHLPEALLLLAMLASVAWAQTTTISGTIYDPRTASALPLPHILVYVATAAPDPLPSGVQCLTTASIPTGAIAYATSAVDGTFTITGVPVSTTYYLVIQAGKWRRIWPNTQVDTTPITGLQLHMPSDHTQGDIPLIAINTGSVDGFECVFHDMGIADSEFSDDNLDPTFIQRIHLYKGNYSSGAVINSSTPNETTLISSPTLLNNYDVVMFPCQSGPASKTTTQMSNIVNYANIGGRLFTTHYSYDWLDQASPYNSGFTSTTNGVTTGVANWSPNLESLNGPSPATVNTGFSGGADIAQWLNNVGATISGTSNQIDISTIRVDTSSVISPTQSWLTLNTGAYKGQTTTPAMQFTFNTPVGAAAANQCGRVLFNEYHVMNLSTTGKIYPKECPTASILPQELMLEYALFDLSAFVQPVITPPLTISFSPSPMIVNQGDTADQVTISAVNTSSSVAIDPSAVLTLTLPTGMTATTLADSTGGWSCTLSTLTCTRTSYIPSSTSASVVLTVSIPSYSASGITSYTGQIAATISSPTFSNNVSGTGDVVFQQTPVIAWSTPANVIYGTALSATQLNATAAVGATNIPGTFVYAPAAGSILTVGAHSLSTTFTPTDSVHYTTATGSSAITVINATPTVTVVSNTNPIFLLNPITFTATISSLGVVPTGTVTFYDGSTQIGTGTVSSGTATFTTSSLAAGYHSIYAAYSGDSTYNPAISGSISQLVEDFTITVTGSGSANLGLGQSATFPLTISPVVSSSFPAAISFSVSGMLPQTSAVFSPSTIAAGTGSLVDYMTVSMASTFGAIPVTPFSPRRTLPLALGLLVLPFAFRLRRAARHWQHLLLVAFAALALAVSFSACSFNYDPKTTSVTVTATSGALSHTATVKVTVQ